MDAYVYETHLELGEAGEFANGVLGPAFAAVDWADAFADNASSIMVYGCNDYEQYVNSNGEHLAPNYYMQGLGSPEWWNVDWSMFSEDGTATCEEAMGNVLDYAESH